MPASKKAATKKVATKKITPKKAVTKKAAPKKVPIKATSTSAKAAPKKAALKDKNTPNASLTPIPAPAGMTVGELLLYYLKMEGVKYVFGIPGGGLANLLYYFMENKKDIEYIVCRQETGAAYIADGYFRASNNLGVVMVTTGPGATNALTGVMNANADGSGMLLVTGEVPQEYYGMGYLQEGENTGLNLDMIYRAAASYSTVIEDCATANAYLKQVLRDIFTLPNRAGHISVPDNVTTEQLPTHTYLPVSPANYRTPQKGAFLNDVTDTLRMLQQAKRPVIFIGNGCREFLKLKGDPAHDAPDFEESRGGLYDLVSFAEEFGIPVMTTPDGKGTFPESHPLSLRVFGCASCDWPYYWLNANAQLGPYGSPPAQGEDPFDAILVIGSSLGDLATMKYSSIIYPMAKVSNFYQVDIDPSVIGRSYPVTKGIIADAGAFIHMLHYHMNGYRPDPNLVKKRKYILKSIKQAVSPFNAPTQYTSNASPIEPAAIMRVLQQKLPKDKPVNFFIDCANCVGWSAHYLEISNPWRIFFSLAMGPMGFGVASVIGGKLGHPEATSICITGDGAFMMQGSEISTARQHKVGAIWIVLQDNDLSMVTQGMQFYYGVLASPPVPDKAWDGLYDIGEPDLAKFAEGLGAQAHTIHSPHELAAILDKVIKAANVNHIPQVIVAKIKTISVPPYYNPLYAVPTAIFPSNPLDTTSPPGKLPRTK